MAKTVWLDAPKNITQDYSWKLANGDLVQPELEISGGGRRLRPKGEKKTFSRYNPLEVQRYAVEKIAHERGTTLVGLHATEGALRQNAYSAVGVGGYDDDLVLRGTNIYARTSWTFQDATGEFTAVVATAISPYWNGNGNMYTGIAATNLWKDSSDAMISRAHETYWNQPGSTDWYSTDYRTLRNWCSTPINDPNTIAFGQKFLPGGRDVVAAFLLQCNELDKVQEVYVPDIRDVNNIKWVKCTRTNTTYDDDFREKLAKVVDSTGALEEVSTGLATILNALQSLGFSVQAKTDRNWLGDVLNGTLETATLVLNVPDDRAHNVVINPVLGTVAVVCGHSVQPVDAAKAFEDAKFLASLKGEDDELLAYAKEYAQSSEVERVKMELARRKQQHEALQDALKSTK